RPILTTCLTSIGRSSGSSWRSKSRGSFVRCIAGSVALISASRGVPPAWRKKQTPLGARDRRPTLELSDARLLQCERPVLDLARALIRRDDDAGARRRHVDGLEPGRDRAFGEEPLPAAEHDREGPHVKLVDEVVPYERLDEVAASVHLDLRSGLLLQLGHVLRHVALDERRVVPFNALERP